ncbi:MAG: hypothetical protein NTW13_02705, partial [Candidatus Omnitrophica bacterium]|nr:hypothetical protein [Candidatus Omnitrophota bacterium]
WIIEHELLAAEGGLKHKKVVAVQNALRRAERKAKGQIKARLIEAERANAALRREGTFVMPSNMISLGNVRQLPEVMQRDMPKLEFINLKLFNWLAKLGGLGVLFAAIALAQIGELSFLRLMVLCGIGGVICFFERGIDLGIINPLNKLGRGPVKDFAADGWKFWYGNKNLISSELEVKKQQIDKKIEDLKFPLAQAFHNRRQEARINGNSNMDWFAAVKEILEKTIGLLEGKDREELLRALSENVKEDYLKQQLALVWQELFLMIESLDAIDKAALKGAYIQELEKNNSAANQKKGNGEQKSSNGEIRDLLVAVVKEIRGVKKQVEGVEKQVEGVEKQVEGVEKQVEGVKKDVEAEKEEIAKMKRANEILQAIRDSGLYQSPEMNLIDDEALRLKKLHPDWTWLTATNEAINRLESQGKIKHVKNCWTDTIPNKMLKAAVKTEIDKATIELAAKGMKLNGVTKLAIYNTVLQKFVNEGAILQEEAKTLGPLAFFEAKVTEVADIVKEGKFPELAWILHATPEGLLHAVRVLGIIPRRDGEVYARFVESNVVGHGQIKEINISNFADRDGNLLLITLESAPFRKLSNEEASRRIEDFYGIGDSGDAGQGQGVSGKGETSEGNNNGSNGKGGDNIGGGDGAASGTVPYSSNPDSFDVDSPFGAGGFLDSLPQMIFALGLGTLAFAGFTAYLTGGIDVLAIGLGLAGIAAVSVAV